MHMRNAVPSLGTMHRANAYVALLQLAANCKHLQPQN